MVQLQRGTKRAGYGSTAASLGKIFAWTECAEVPKRKWQIFGAERIKKRKKDWREEKKLFPRAPEVTAKWAACESNVCENIANFGKRSDGSLSISIYRALIFRFARGTVCPGKKSRRLTNVTFYVLPCSRKLNLTCACVHKHILDGNLYARFLPTDRIVRIVILIFKRNVKRSCIDLFYQYSAFLHLKKNIWYKIIITINCK